MQRKAKKRKGGQQVETKLNQHAHSVRSNCWCVYRRYWWTVSVGIQITLPCIRLLCIRATCIYIRSHTYLCMQVSFPLAYSRSLCAPFSLALRWVAPIIIIILCISQKETHVITIIIFNNNNLVRLIKALEYICASRTRTYTHTVVCLFV